MLLELALISGASAYWLKNKNPEESSDPPSANVSKPKFSAKKLFHDLKNSLFANERQALEESLDPERKAAADKEKQALNRGLMVGGATLGVSLLASSYPLLFIPAIAGIVYLLRDIFGFLARDFKRGHYLSAYLLNVIVGFGMIVTGHLLLMTLGSILLFVMAKIVKKAEDSLEEQLINVFANHPSHVWLEKNGVEIQVEFQTVQAGNTVIVNAGETIPVDGLILTGEAYVDQQILTGESQPIERMPGDKVFAATVLLSGRITITVETAGEETVAAQIGHALNQTQHYKEELMARGQKIADEFLPLELGTSAVTFVALGPVSALAILWSGLGYRMILFGPLSVLHYLQTLSRKGILIKDGRVLESLQQVDTVVFDKTGTLTLEQPYLGAIHLFGTYDEDTLLTYAAAAEHRQPHPVAQAILDTATARGLDVPQHSQAHYEMGYGIKVRLAEKTICVGSERFMRQEQVVFSRESVANIQQQAQAIGHSLVYIGIDGVLEGVLEMQPRLRPEVPKMVQALQKRGINIYIMSGDHTEPTRNMAEQLGITDYFAETLPEHKADLVKQLRQQGRFVCFVGDGINDAIALKSAQISISLKGASTAATDTAQVIFMDSTLNSLDDLFQMSDEFEETMHSNFVFSIVPGAINISSVYLLHVGLASSMALYYTGSLVGLGNTMVPLIKHQDTEAFSVENSKADVTEASKTDATE